MDTEQQIRLNFLDEAEEYLDSMESGLLELADTVIEAQNIDLVLRCAHSIKGGAGMMGFDVLSAIAHRLEDFFKILRVRHVGTQIDTEVEVLLLQGIDYLRNIAQLHRQGKSVDPLENDNQTIAIFERLTQHLGELEVADENALLAQDEDIDPAVLIFEEGVEGILDGFEAKLQGLSITELTTELTNTAQELVGFGMMADLNAFVELCESIQQQVAHISPSEIESLAASSLKTWRRSHALVLRGSPEKLPTGLEGYESVPADREEFDPLAIEGLDLTGLESAFEADVDPNSDVEEFDPLAVEGLDLTGLESAFEAESDPDSDVEEFNPLAIEGLNLEELQSAFEIETVSGESEPTSPEPSTSPLASFPSSTSPQVEKMVRVPLSQLKQFNTLFEQLVLNRNSIGLRVAQLQNIVGLIGRRMSQMEQSNAQLREWYDRASVEGLLNSEEKAIATSAISTDSQLNSQTGTLNFDALEMDRYSDIHLICQEQLETIVQLQEVATDVQLGMREVHQSVRDLHYTTKSMQGNVTRTQMLPFSEAAKRLPRVIRELNRQFDKSVTLKITGETTFLDRLVIEALSDPLMHLLRNSFDHGIEDRETRLATGKAESGTITINASNQGTYTIITVSDDGGGINLDKIRDRVCQMGITRSEVEQILSTELLDFIFEPGFSTAKEVTELSGRGVGMDVVRSNLQEVGGDVRVITNPGKGTTFTLKIPFTLSILRVAVIEQGDFIFAIPANTIKELIPEKLSLIADTEDSTQRVSWQDKAIPLLKIDEILYFSRSPRMPNLLGEPTIDLDVTLIVGDEQSSVALQIGRFWNEQESTTRKIESPIALPACIISSVVFGDGKVIPLIDPLALAQESLDGHFSKERLNLDSELNSDTQSKILIIDDSINVRQYLSLTLERAGYRVEQARDGREAVEKLLDGLTVDAVICDLEMPRLDGYGVLEEIKALPEFANLPIAMLTSRSNEKHRKLAMNLGASAYFSKPFNEKELLDKLAKFTSSNTAHAAS